MAQKSHRQQGQPAKKKNTRSSSGADRDARLHRACLTLAARDGWIDLDLREVYDQAALRAPSRLGRRDVWRLASDILSRIDAEALALCPAADQGSPWRDRLFDVLMNRFDLMQRDREAFSDLFPAALAESCTAGPVLTRRLARGIAHLLDACGVPLAKSSGPRRALAVVVAVALYLSVVDVWRQDQSPDMAKTMAALDSRIGWLEKALISAT